MHIEDFEYFRDRLLERNDDLNSWLNSRGARGVEDIDKARHVLRQIDDALDRIENESFGKCKICDGEIERERLEAHPEVEICLDCLSESEKRAIEDDMKMAGRLQRALLPPSVPKIDGFDIAARLMGAGSVGGDYYDFLPCGEGNQLSRIIIADAMGHGVASGLLMSNLQGALRILAEDIHSPGELVSRLNQWLCRNVPVTKFISLISLCLEKTGNSDTRLKYTNAGHCPPVVVRSDGSIERFDVTGGILGVHEDFNYKERILTFSPGDFVLLFTDGVVEAENPRGEEFGEDRLTEFICNHKRPNVESVINDLFAEVTRFTDTTVRSDDMTVLGLLKR